MNETQLSAKYQADKELALSQLNLQNYHPSLVDNGYKAKFMMNSDAKQPEGGLVSGLHPNIFALNSISNQYAKNIDVALNRAQSTVEDPQNIRVKQLFSMTNNETSTKTFAENQNSSKNQTNDRNNNKNSSSKEKPESATQFKDFEVPAEKSQSQHTNSKSGVSLKCAYCEAREDFKSR